uniref:Uncharacterized protein n=1 Tax=Lygus hesperus TaxID=30085 RepID=A0A0K8SXP2_LYGHE
MASSSGKGAQIWRAHFREPNVAKLSSPVSSTTLTFLSNPLYSKNDDASIFCKLAAASQSLDWNTAVPFLGPIRGCCRASSLEFDFQRVLSSQTPSLHHPGTQPRLEYGGTCDSPA